MGMNLVLLGAPGSGKGTFAARVSDTLTIPPISTGEILRQAVRSGTPIGNEAKGYMEGGKLVPDEVMSRVLKGRLAESDCAKGFILDGYPRTIAQAHLLDETLTAAGTAVTWAVSIEVTDELVMRRLGGRRSCPKCGAVYNIHTLKPAVEGICDKCGEKIVTRPDDQPETIRKRLNVYAEQSAPLIAHYRARGVLKTLDGGAPLDEVVALIVGYAKQVPAS
jgi:adenylate kinase